MIDSPTPEGGVIKFDELRHRMVDEQLVARGIHDQRVLNAVAQVRREEFVPSPLQLEAYEDWPLPIGSGQTISQPFTVAYMIEALQLKGPENVLEVGTGCGYAAAVLSCLAREVHTVERVRELALTGRQRLEQLGYNNVSVHAVDGSLGLPRFSPFDAIVVTAGAPVLPAPYADQLRDGGRIVIPIGGAPNRQRLYRFTKRGGGLVENDLGSFAFVPLIGQHGWDKSD